MPPVPRNLNPILQELGITRDLPEAVTVPGVLQDAVGTPNFDKQPYARPDASEMVYGIEDIINLLTSRQYPDIEASLMKGLDDELFQQYGSKFPANLEGMAQLRWNAEDSGNIDDYMSALSDQAIGAGPEAQLADLLGAVGSMRHRGNELTDLEPILRYIMSESQNQLGTESGRLERLLNNILTKADPSMADPPSYPGATNMADNLTDMSGVPTQMQVPLGATLEGRMADQPPQDENAVLMALANNADERGLLPTLENAKSEADLIAMLMEMIGYNKPQFNLDPNDFN